MPDDILVEWSDSFSVGNKIIDDQHKELVRLTNELYAGTRMGGVLAKVYFLKSIQGAVHYVKTHFATEEELMKKANYPEYDIHRSRHDDFVAEVFRQVQKLEKEDNPNSAEFIKYLMNWVVKHIAEMDKKYMPYLSKLEE